MGLLGAPREKGWNFHIRDDGKFEIRELVLESGWLIEKRGEKEIAAYMQPYKTVKHFDGYGKFPACNMTVTYPRDILFDPFHQLTLNEKPEKGISLKKQMMSRIAESTVNKHEQDAKPTSSTDKIIIFLGSVIVILAFCIGIQVLVNRGG